MNIKRIIFILLLWWIFISVSEANIYVDANAAFTQTVDAKNQFGGGIGLLFSVHRDINVFLKGIFNTRIRNYGEDDEVSYNHIMNLAGLEYRYNISNMPLYWKSSIGIGIGNTQIDYKNYNSLDQNDNGFSAAAWTGLEYIFTQHLSSFIDVGFHKSFYTEKLKDSDIMGLQVLLGLRVTIFGKNRSIFSDY